MTNSLTNHVVLVGVVLLCLEATASSQTPDPKGLALFESKIRPVLVNECYQCHSVEAAKTKKLRGNLQLDTREGTLKGGDAGPAIVPGDPKKSLLLAAMRHDEKVEKMPPRGKLSNEVIADFTKWIELGAPDPRVGGVLPSKRTIDIAEGKKFWSFRPLTNVPSPVVKNSNWVRTPIDQFILAGLEAKGLKPSNSLSKQQLIRRVTFDLTGLPPTAEEVTAFINDTTPDAYEKLLTRLLASERYGERWGRHWLDVVRFAESGGYEFDGDRPGAFHYRDFVIKALNSDVPFDQFVKLQLAGDELQPNDLFATAATGFITAGPYPGQTTAKTLEPIRYDHLDDMVSTTASAFLGLTLGCARCHEHKYDPIPQQDYYRLIAALGRTDSMTRQMDPDPEVYRKAKAAFDATHAPLAQSLALFEKDTLPGRFEKWLALQKEKPVTPWLTLEPSNVTGKATFKKLDDGSYLASGKAEKGDAYTISAATSFTKITAIRLEAMLDNSLPKNGPGRSPDGTFTLSEVTLTATPNAEATKKGAKPVVVKFKPGKATSEQGENTLAKAVDGNSKTGWSVTGGKNQSATFIAETPFGFDGGTTLAIAIKFESDFAAGRFRLAFATSNDADRDAATQLQVAPEIFALLAAQGGKLEGKNREQIIRWFRKVDPLTEEEFAIVDRSLAKEPKPLLQPVFAATSGRGGDVHYLIRGETERKNGVAAPGFVQVLINTDENRWLREKVDPKAPPKLPRVALADWLTDDKHGAGHLLARVIVNRLWQHHFGKGLVRTPNDFGAQGEPPTHPELLDFLAAELIKGGWKLKPIHKMIMLSSVYQQGRDSNETAIKTDPQNRLWWSVPPRRLEAEAIRDSLLMIGSSLDLKMFGPGVLDENNPRRSVYLTVKRSRLLPMLQAFDSPEPIQSVGERSQTTATTQALMMMNSPLVRQQAEKLAKAVMPVATADVSQSVEKAYRIVLGRPPIDAERQQMTDFILFAAGNQGKKGLETATADFCQALLCLNEFLYVD